MECGFNYAFDFPCESGLLQSRICWHVRLALNQEAVGSIPTSATRGFPRAIDAGTS